MQTDVVISLTNKGVENTRVFSAPFFVSRKVQRLLFNGHCRHKHYLRLKLRRIYYEHR